MTGLKEQWEQKLLHQFSVSPKEAPDRYFYEALTQILRDRMRASRVAFVDRAHVQDAKQVYYLCMEFLMGRSLENALENLGLKEEAEDACRAFGFKLSDLFIFESDAGLGNGGLGRLAACFLDGLANARIPAVGYSLLYEYGIFRQRLIDGWQTELPDFWLPGGGGWLIPRPELTKEVLFDGNVVESWEDGYHRVSHENATHVLAHAFDMMVPSKGGHCVSTLRLWKAQAPGGIDMALFNQGEYFRAMEQSAKAQAITQVLYPADNHRQGKSLRLTQQYFLVSASVQDIVERHLKQYPSMDSFPDRAAVHLNDTHPTLAIPELMRILLDECGYGWENAWDIVCRSVGYTNHTVMAEALECWPEDLFAERLPRIYQIVKEIDARYKAEVREKSGGNEDAVNATAILQGGLVKMANLCVAAAHSVNGVSTLHSEIIKTDVFPAAAALFPEKFTSVTNGIAHRRWLCQANPRLTAFLKERIGDGFVTDASELEKLAAFADDPETLAAFADVKQQNKKEYAEHLFKKTGQRLNTDAPFDVQVKRLHEYKRQHLNALHIVDRYLELKENPNADVAPRVYFFGAKAAPGYFLAKEIIRFICKLGQEIEADPAVRDRLQVVFVENYCVTAAQQLIPCADVSEQISLAGTEASGTGNMKLMMNGAVTLGTLDGANIEIVDAVGRENAFLFGMTAPEVAQLKHAGYHPRAYYENDPRIRRALDFMAAGFGGRSYKEIVDSLLNADPYMVLADFEDYRRAQALSAEVYADKDRFTKMAMLNTAKSGYFSSDRAIQDYSDRIWHCRPVED